MTMRLLALRKTRLVRRNGNSDVILFGIAKAFCNWFPHPPCEIGIIHIILQVVIEAEIPEDYLLWLIEKIHLNYM